MADQETTSPDETPSEAPGNAIEMFPEMGDLSYPATDELGRCGLFKPGEIYAVPGDLSPDEAALLVASGPFRWITI